MTHRRTLPSIALVLALCLLAAAPASAAVFIARHAEKQTEANEKEVPLSEAGRARAKRIAEMLRDAGVVAVYSTDTVRTLSTAAPLAEIVKVKPIVYSASGPDGTVDLKPLAKKILEDQGSRNVFVVGHSNTIGPLIEALGCKESVTVGGAEYDGLWIVVPASAGGGPPALLRLRQ
ncbi:MAG TPA: histidine phosphatase family protein [Thermoanaerobaculia bacterium]